jgi:hypothetical protein
MTSDLRQRAATPSPLVAALAEAVIERHAKRAAGLVPAVVGNVVDIVKMDRRDPAHPRHPGAVSAFRDRGLVVVDGGRRAQTDP